MKKEHGLLPRRVEGLGESRWILMDYLDVVVHVFTPEARDFYRLEQLWGEAPEARRRRVADGLNDEAAHQDGLVEVELGGSNPRPLAASQTLSQLSYSPKAVSLAQFIADCLVVGSRRQRRCTAPLPSELLDRQLVAALELLRSRPRCRRSRRRCTSSGRSRRGVCRQRARVCDHDDVVLRLRPLALHAEEALVRCRRRGRSGGPRRSDAARRCRARRRRRDAASAIAPLRVVLRHSNTNTRSCRGRIRRHAAPPR